MGLLDFVGNLVFQRPGDKAGMGKLIYELTINGKTLVACVREAEGNLGQEEVLRHIIGIERWGQRRLKVALGEKFVEDEYNPYRPPNSHNWQHLIEDFQETRAETIRLAKEIQHKGTAETQVPHNDFGELNMKGWLKYLNRHANLELGKIRRPLGIR
jgi:hypothetical protein